MLTRVLNMQRDGRSWRQIAQILQLPSPQVAKKLAKEAAAVSQQWMIRKGVGKS